MERHELIVDPSERNVRLEDLLFDRFPGLSRMYLREVVRDGNCEVNGRNENVGRRLRGGDFIEIHLDATRETAMRPEKIPIDIVFEDPHLIVVNKPAGMLVHPTHREKRGTLLNALAHHLNAERMTQNGELETKSREPSRGTRHDKGISVAPNSALRLPHAAFVRPGLVHRLDKETSGLMVIAKSVAIHRKLARQFQKKRVEKKYLALVEGIVPADEGTIERTIGRFADEKRWGVKDDGKHSMTKYRAVERRIDCTLLELEPVTGRTNQLRIHCTSIGHPIVGDVSRGGREFHRLCLHAFKLAFDHPIGGSRVSFELDSRAQFDLIESRSRLVKA